MMNIPINEKDFPIKYKVFEHFDTSKGRSVLKLAKPDAEPGQMSCETRLQLGHEDYPTVCMKRESAANAHAVDIMCGINHKNIVSMKAVGPKLQDDFLVFIEECDGVMNSVVWGVINDRDGHIPCETFQDIVSEIIKGVEFLRRNNTYHGNLSWPTTFYRKPYTVKLCNFKSNDSPDTKDAQWQDWMFIRQMLQDVSDQAKLLNQKPETVKLWHDEIDALIELIDHSDRNSLHLMKDNVLEDVFFWKLGRRTRFIVATVSELMLNLCFVKT